MTKSKFTRSINHISKVKEWDSYQPKDAKTLILGSFNPYNKNLEEQTDFYYGRISNGRGNRLWSTIGKLKYNNENYFKGNLENKLKELKESKVIFFDLINCIEFNSEGKKELENYIESKVLGDFGDSSLWVSEAEDKNITLTREYNYQIIDFLKKNTSIKKIITTLGNNRMENLGLRKKNNGKYQKNKKDKNWIDFRKTVFKIIEQKNIELITESISPSPSRRPGDDGFDNWVKRYLLK